MLEQGPSEYGLLMLTKLLKLNAKMPLRALVKCLLYLNLVVQMGW